MNASTPLAAQHARQNNWQDGLRRLRGHNRYRGRAVWLWQPLRLLLECAPTQGGLPQGYLVIYLATEDADAYFAWQGQRYDMRQAGTTDAFLDLAMTLCRGKSAYIRTRDDVADYK